MRPTARQSEQHAIRTLGVITVSRADDPEAFDRILSGWSDERIIKYVSGDSNEAETADAGEGLIQQWRDRGAAAYRAGIPRGEVEGGKRALPHVLVGWDMARTADTNEE